MGGRWARAKGPTLKDPKVHYRIESDDILGSSRLRAQCQTELADLQPVQHGTGKPHSTKEGRLAPTDTSNDAVGNIENLREIVEVNESNVDQRTRCRRVDKDGAR